MNVPTWIDAYESLSLSDREMLAHIHGIAAAHLAPELSRSGMWQRMLLRQTTQTQALVQRVRRAGGSMPAVFVEAVGGPLRTNMATLSPRALLSIYNPLSPLESAYVSGLLWPLQRRDGQRDWVVLPDIERELLAVPALLEATTHRESTAATTLDLDEVLLALATAVRMGGVVLGRGSRLPQRVLHAAHLHGGNDVQMSWLVSICLAGHALRVGMSELEIGPSMNELLRATPQQRRLELLRNWLLAAWDEWQLAPDKRTRGIDMRQARRSMAYALLPHVPESWMPVTELLVSIRVQWPDIVRPVTTLRKWLPPAGWPIHWEDQDGAVVRLNMAGPLQWLGCVEWGADEQLVRRTHLGSWIAGLAPIEAKKQHAPVIFESDFSLILPDSADLWARYQLDWLGIRQDGMTWQLSPQTIQRAVAGGMSIDGICTIIGELTKQPVDRDVRQQLALWAGSVAVVALATECVVTTQSTAALNDIVNDRRVGVRNGRRLNDKTLALPLHDRDRIVKNLRQAGYALHLEGQELVHLRESDLRLIEQALRAHNDNVQTRAVLHKIGLMRQSEQRDG